MLQYHWRVMKNNRFAGYVLAISCWEAERKAAEYYGKNIWVERLLYGSVSFPKV